MPQQHPTSLIENATEEDYRHAGRKAGETYVAQHQGDHGLEPWMAARNTEAVDRAVTAAGEQMLAAGATEAKVQAWAEGFAEVVGAFADKRDRDGDVLAVSTPPHIH